MNEFDIINEWLQIAYDDYSSALYLFGKPNKKPLEIICYHCQQAVEKSLKAYLCANDLDIPKTHDTGLLCRKCMEINEAFSTYIKACEELVIYATETRYPIRIEIDEITAKRNLKQSLEIYDFVKSVLDNAKKSKA